MKAIKSIKDLPERVQGNGLRADEYTAYSNHVTVAVLNDDEFNKVIEHNTRVNDNSKQYDVLTISNERDYVIIRDSAFAAPFTPERTAKEEAERLVDKYYWIFGDGYLGNQHILCAIADCDNTITALKLRGIDTTYEEEVLTILKGM